MNTSFNNLFEQATRKNLTFDSPKGQLTVQDLWQLPLTSRMGKANLEDIAKDLHRQVKAQDDQPSFFTEAKPVDNDVALKLNVVIYIGETLKKEKAEADTAAERKAQKQKILELIDRKQGEALEMKSIEELQAELAKL
jgi:hypothetical protein